MKVSLNWIQELVGFDLPPVDELVGSIGAQLGAVDSVTDLGKKYQGIVIVKVINCEKLEGSDHLSVCRIDDGQAVKDIERDEAGLVQVICGAPNCREGMSVAWLPPGTTVPASMDDAEPFQLEVREIRGQTSNGMLASPRELALGDSHDGLLVLDGGKPGEDFAKTYQLDDVIIDIENKMFTHRPDCFGMLGVAREIAGILGKPFTSPAIYKDRPAAASSDAGDLEVRNELPELVPRFVAQVFDNVKLGPSSLRLQSYLSRVGVRPINNVVDITNYVMLLTGQPLHAYDYDKVKALSEGDKPVIVVRNPKPSEKLTLLGGKQIEPRPEAIMIATNKQLIGLGGVMGGADTEVDDKTTKIILECANFDMYSVRRSSMAHGLFTEAVSRFNKGQSPLQNDRIAAWAADQLVQDTGCRPGSRIDLTSLEEDDLARDSLFQPVKVTSDFINQRLGLELTADDIKALLENVEFLVAPSSDQLTVIAPFWRTDIEVREDIVEEVGRLYGYNRVPLELPGRDLTPAARNDLLEVKDRVRERLSRAGANEVLTYSFVPADLLSKAGQLTDKAFQVGNALSPGLEYFRLSLMPSLLEKIHPNIKAGYDRFALFEIGKSHNLDDADDGEGVPKEFEITALVVTAADKLKPAGAAYYQARKYLEEVVGNKDILEFKVPDSGDLEFELVKPYDPKRSAVVSVYGGEALGIIGEFKPGVLRALKLPKYTAGFEIDTEALSKVWQSLSKTMYRPLPRFPKVTQDITLKVPVSVADGSIHDLMLDQLDLLGKDGYYTEFDYLDIYTGGGDAKHVTFRVHIASNERTLTDAEVNKLLDTIAAVAKKQLGAERL